MSWEEHGLTSYPDYFKTPHWHALKQEYLWKRGAVCHVCGIWSKLLIHHISYANLFAEKPYRDFYIVCFDCHTKCHFWTQFRLKVPLRTSWLLLSLRMRKLEFCIRNKQFRLSVIYFLIIILTGYSTIFIGLLEILVLWMIKIFWIVLKYLLSKINIDIV